MVERICSSKSNSFYEVEKRYHSKNNPIWRCKQKFKHVNILTLFLEKKQGAVLAGAFVRINMVCIAETMSSAISYCHTAKWAKFTEG